MTDDTTHALKKIEKQDLEKLKDQLESMEGLLRRAIDSKNWVTNIEKQVFDLREENRRLKAECENLRYKLAARLV
jgi:hypothetical protein